MALAITSARYIAITSLNINMSANQAVVQVGSWLTKTDKDAKKPPLSVSSIVYNQTSTPSFSSLLVSLGAEYAAIKSALYTALKTRPEFAGASDV